MSIGLVNCIGISQKEYQHYPGFDFNALTRPQQRILTSIKQNPGISISELVWITKINKRVIQNNIKKLREMMIICKVGHNRETGYEYMTRERSQSELHK